MSDSTPMISANPFLATNQPESEAKRFVTKQDSDNLPVSEERHKKQFEDFASAKTHLYDFQVRKSPGPANKTKQLENMTNMKPL